MDRMDERCQPGALIRCVSERLYRVLFPEGKLYKNYGLLGGVLGGGLFVQMEGGHVDNRCQRCRSDKPRGHFSWLSPQTVMNSRVEIRATEMV